MRAISSALVAPAAEAATTSVARARASGPSGHPGPAAHRSSATPNASSQASLTPARTSTGWRSVPGAPAALATRSRLPSSTIARVCDGKRLA